MQWNCNIEEAPRGTIKTEKRKHKDGDRNVDVFIHDFVILACRGGEVLRSYWLPKQERWAGLATGETPVAWMPWPSHPEATQ